MTSNNRVAVITGAAQGIGRRTAEVLAERGYSLALNDLRSPDDTLRSVQSSGADTMPYVGNIADESTVEGFAREVENRWGRVDVLVNNAGISFIMPAESTAAADYRRVLEVNLVAPFLLAKAFGAKMLGVRRVATINFASTAA